jgi:hypothetical protein
MGPGIKKSKVRSQNYNSKSKMLKHDILAENSIPRQILRRPSGSSRMTGEGNNAPSPSLSSIEGEGINELRSLPSSRDKD